VPGVEPDQRPIRWVEVDPWGHAVTCLEETWAQKVRQHAEIASHEQAIRETIRDPDALFYDPESTARRQHPTGAPRIWIVHYVSAGRTHGKQAGNFVRVVARWEDADGGRTRVGYVHTMLLPDGVEPRLQLAWERHP